MAVIYTQNAGTARTGTINYTARAYLPSQGTTERDLMNNDI